MPSIVTCIQNRFIGNISLMSTFRWVLIVSMKKETSNRIWFGLSLRDSILALGHHHLNDPFESETNRLENDFDRYIWCVDAEIEIRAGIFFIFEPLTMSMKTCWFMKTPLNRFYASMHFDEKWNFWKLLTQNFSNLINLGHFFRWWNRKPLRMFELVSLVARTTDNAMLHIHRETQIPCICTHADAMR